MKFDARTEHSPEKKEAFVAWLTGETASMFERADGDRERLKAAVFLFSNRAREAGLLEAEVADTLGVSIARAALSKEEEEAVLDFAETIDPLATAVYAGHGEQNPWWKFWS